MFVLDSVGKAFLIPHSGLKITFDITTGPGDYITTEPHFTIVDEQGRAYYYNSREYMQNSGEDKYPSKWMLSSLSDLADNKIYLEYYPADNYSFQNYSYHGELKLTKSKYGIDKYLLAITIPAPIRLPITMQVQGFFIK